MSEVIVFKFSKDWDFGNSLFCEAADVIAEDGEKFIRHEDHERELAALREELAQTKRTAITEIEALNRTLRNQASEVVAAEQRNAELVLLLKRAEPLVRRHEFQRAIDVADEMQAAFKPTESGASE